MATEKSTEKKDNKTLLKKKTEELSNVFPPIELKYKLFKDDTTSSIDANSKKSNVA